MSPEQAQALIDYINSQFVTFIKETQDVTDDQELTDDMIYRLQLLSDDLQETLLTQVLIDSKKMLSNKK